MRTVWIVDRQIKGFVNDDKGEWVAVLDCHHRQHVRHQPPFRPNAWVLVDSDRNQRIGSRLDCPLCDRCELPDGLELLRTTPTWDETSMPDGLRRNHRVASATWGLLRVEAGSLRFVANTEPATEVEIVEGKSQPIPPDVEHHVEVVGPVRFAVDFLGTA